MTTEDNREQLAELRKRLKENLLSCPDYDNDFNLQRWLQAYSNEIDGASKALRQHLRFRKASNIGHSSLKTRNELLKAYYPTGLFNQAISDTDNRVLSIECAGKLNVEALQKSVSSIEVFMDRAVVAEAMLRAIRDQEKRTGSQFYIYQITDLDGLCLDYKAFLSLMIGPNRRLQEFLITHYGGMLGRMVIINAPSFMGYVWSALSQFLPQWIIDKVAIFSSDDPDACKAALLKDIDPERLPVKWGGKKRDPDGDPTCRSIVTIPPESGIPEDKFFKDSVSDDELTTLYVSGGKGEFVSIQVQESKVLEIYFTTNGEHSFGVFYTKDAKELAEIVAAGQEELNEAMDEMDMIFPYFECLPVQTVPEIVRLKCEKTGYYHIKFGYEMGWWWQTLTIKYKTQLS